MAKRRRTQAVGVPYGATILILLVSHQLVMSGKEVMQMRRRKRATEIAAQ
jgi:hypothetical protein